MHGRQTFPYPVTEGLPVIEEQSGDHVPQVDLPVPFRMPLWISTGLPTIRKTLWRKQCAVRVGSLRIRVVPWWLQSNQRADGTVVQSSLAVLSAHRASNGGNIPIQHCDHSRHRH